MVRLFSLLLLSLFIMEVEGARTQARPEVDTARVYRLGEIVIGGEKEREVKTATVQQLPFTKIQRTDAPTAAALMSAGPAARVQTNSRGEALLYLRGTGERQVAVFLDGALLNIPWDNRVDLSLVPLNAIGGVSITKGVPSVLYGANVIGGAVNFVSQEKTDKGVLTDILLSGGQAGYVNGSVTNMGAIGDFNYVATAGYVDRKGFTVPKHADLPFNQAEGELRTNTQTKILNGYLRGEYKLSELSILGLSLNYMDAEKGIAPEGHKNRSIRFWQYPDWTNLNVTLNGDFFLNDARDWSLRGAAWSTTFKQNINQYTNVKYDVLKDREEDADQTFGTRLVLRKDFETDAINLAINAYQSTHDQRDLRYDSSGLRGKESDYTTLNYKLGVYSLGLEYEHSFTNDLGVIVGGSYDMMNTPETGGKPSQDAFSDFSSMAGLHYDVSPTLTLRTSAGRKTRFPTMRELYGEALGTFVINPNLKPEESIIAELGMDGRFDWGTLSLVGFNYATRNTIERIDLLSGPDSGMRQRVNLEGSNVPGVELSTSYLDLDPLRLDLSVTYMQPRTTKANADGTNYLSERPDLLANFNADYRFSFGLNPSLEVAHFGRAFSLDGGKFVDLGAATLVNIRLAYRVLLGTTTTGQVFVRANDIFDAVYLPQIGLPGAGRELQAGIKFSF